MDKKIVFPAAILLGFILVFVVFQFFPIQELYQMLIRVDISLFLAYLAVSFVIQLILVVRWIIICREQDINLPFIKLLGYRYVGVAISFITPGPKVGGEPVRAALLKRDGIDFTKSLSSVVADKTVELISFGIMFLIALAITLFYTPLPPSLLYFLLAVFAIIFVLIGGGFYEIIRGKDPILRFFKLIRFDRSKLFKKYEKEIKEFEGNIQVFYSQSQGAFFKALVVSAAAWAVSLVEFYLILQMLGLSGNFMQVFLIFSAVGLAYMIPIPMALGSLEATQAGLFIAIGFTAAAGAALSIITRGRDLLWTLTGFVLLAYFGFDSVKDIDK